MILEPGILLNNRYRIIEVLGQGGMGSIYRARDENLDIDVAVKDNLFGSDEFARQFRREATILATLRHSGLPRVTDHFMVEGQGQYLVMDYIGGEDLRQRMERMGTLPEDEVITIGAAICDALMYLSTRDPVVVHRDIKPGNVKITPEGEIFLVDFGLAKTIQGTQMTTTGARAMTPGYSPPEQYGSARTDQRTDIFSLGATLFAALTGMTPEDSLARAMNQEKLTPLRSWNPHVSKKLAAAIEKALELLPEDRYQSPEEFKQALINSSSSFRKREGEYFITPPPVIESPPAILAEIPKTDESQPDNHSKPQESGRSSPGSPISPERKMDVLPSRKRPHQWVGRLSIILIIILLTALGSFTYLYFRAPDHIPDLLANALHLPQGRTPVLTSTTSSLPLTIVATSTAWQQITKTVAEPTQTSTLVSAAISPTAKIQVAPEATPTHLPSPSPTPLGGGTGQMAFVSKINSIPQILLINSDGTNRRQITQIKEGACQPDFSPDGERIVFISPCDSNNDYYPGSSMYLINIDGSGLLPLPTMVGGDFDPAWSPDGKHIAFTSLRNSNRSKIFLMNLDDYSVEALSEEYMFDSQPAWSPDGSQILFTTQRNNRQDIWVMNPDGSGQRQFSRTQNMIDLFPSWCPDGENVLITQYADLAGVPRVVIAPFNLEKYTEYQIGKERRPMREAVMSPDGYWIAFEGWEMGGKHNIFVITSTGINVQQVTDEPTQAFDVAWRPLSKP